jgi:hypothetical protein
MKAVLPANLSTERSFRRRHRKRSVGPVPLRLSQSGVGLRQQAG